MQKWPNKDPNDILDYSIDWGGVLDPGDAISTGDWIVPAPLVAGAKLITGTVASVWLSGGEAGWSYRVTNRITTTAGRQYDETGLLAVRDA